MSQKFEVVSRLFSLLEGLSPDPSAYDSVYHPSAIQTEFPNLLTRNKHDSDLAELRKRAQVAAKMLAAQKFTVINRYESGDVATYETIWTGTMAIDAGPFKKGQALKCYICMIFEFKDGRILRQRNYDCYEAFA